MICSYDRIAEVLKVDSRYSVLKVRIPELSVVDHAAILGVLHVAGVRYSSFVIVTTTGSDYSTARLCKSPVLCGVPPLRFPKPPRALRAPKAQGPQGHQQCGRALGFRSTHQDSLRLPGYFRVSEDCQFAAKATLHGAVSAPSAH